MIIDTHSHLNFKAYDKDREEVIKRTQEAGITCINVGTKFETSKAAVELAEQSGNMFAAIGLHPIHVKTDVFQPRMDEDEGGFTPAGEAFDKDKYKELVLSAGRRVVAIGEIGLDYYYKPKTKAKLETFKQKQKEVFLQQLDFAKECNLPVILHCRVAHKDMIEILKKERRGIKGGVVHCFTGSLEEMQQYIALGFFIGINGIIFKLPLEAVVKECPLEKILVETDCPYLIPKPALQQAGTPAAEGDLGAPPMAEKQRNEPIFIKHTIERVAELKGLSVKAVSQQTTENARNLFGL